MHPTHSVLHLTPWKRLLVVGGLALTMGGALAQGPATAPEANHAPSSTATAVFAGGCFWGLEAVFEHVRGVKDVRSGYAGGAAKDADYETVSTGRTGHAEAVQVQYDPKQVSYGELLSVFFFVAHDPTQLNRQHPDTGPQYRSALFTTSEQQAESAQAYLATLQHKHAFDESIKTTVQPLPAFYTAERYHQDYLARHHYQPYIVMYDAPKLVVLEKTFPKLYVR